MPTSAADGRPRHTGGSSVLGRVMPHLMAHLTRNGYDADPIPPPAWLRRSRFHLPDVRLPESAAHEAWQMAATMTGDDALGVHVAESLPAGALDLVEVPVPFERDARSRTRAPRPLWAVDQRPLRGPAPAYQPPRCIWSSAA